MNLFISGLMEKRKEGYKIVLAGLLAIQMGVILYVNLFQMKYHLGYDVSSYMMKAVEVWRQKTLFIDHWNHQTTLYIDNAMPIASLLYGITHDIFISYGIANCIVSALLLFVFLGICKSLGFNSSSSLISANFFVCPYIMQGLNNWNDLGYFSMMFTSMASYGVKTLTILTVIKLVMDLESGKASRLLLIFTPFLCFVAGLSSGLYVAVTVMVPAYIYIAVKVLVKNDWKEVLSRQSLHLSVSVAALMIGKFFTEKVIGFLSMDSEMVWVSLWQFWTNLASIFVGFLQLLGALPDAEKVDIMNRHGIIYVFSFFLVMICLLALVAAIVKVCKKFWENRTQVFFVSIVVFNIFLFTIVYTTYGAGTFEARYLIEPFIAIMFLIGFWMNGLEDKLIFKDLACIGIMGSLFIVNMVSDYSFITTLNNYDELRAVADSLDKIDTPFVYVLGEEERGDARNLRVIDTTRVYKSCTPDGQAHHYGDYTYYDENSEYTGMTAIISLDTSVSEIPEYIMNTYTQVDHVGRFGIYVSDKNILDSTSGITEADYSIDFPYTRNTELQNGIFAEDASYVTDGTEGYVMQGADSNTQKGIYDITLKYEILESKKDVAATFAIVKNDVEEPVATVDITGDSAKKSITLENVTFDNNTDMMKYQVYAYSGAKIKIMSVEYQRHK